MSITRHHADWLSLVEVSGPFVSLPVLIRAFPQGLEPRDPAQAKVLRAAYEEWRDNPTAPGKRRAWVMHVLTSVLGYPENQIAEGQTLPAGLEASMPEVGETLRPDFALVGPAGTATAGQPQLLIANYAAEQSLDKPVIGKHWKATPATRMMELLHVANVPLGLVTNGEQWMLVYAPRGETTGYASWYGALWLDEPITLRAFHSLLGVRRFFGVAADSTLLSLLKESASDQQEVTDQLGYQVREAVEVLVQSFDELDKESQRASLKGIQSATVYDAALTIMMRLVFLFSAEERGLLHLGKPLYDDNYAVSTLQEQLQEVADRYGEEVLERRYDAWTRLLATFRAVHGGIHHQDLLMQAYGGSLFDPDRYPFLEGRTLGSEWQTTPAEPLAVNNRVVLHLLNSLQRLRIKIGAGGLAETRRVSFRALGVEQIGHVYEGLLDHTALRATEVVLGIRGTRSREPEISLSTLESLAAQGENKLLEHLKEETGRSLLAIRREFNNGGIVDAHKLLVACNHDEALVARLRPFAGLIRDDSFERPWVVLPGSIFVTAGTTRRSTGTHYTPPLLTEPIVQHTLEPQVYVGPTEGLPKDRWELKSPKEILDLKVCDMAMGSGAFLVQACRYLAERLVEAWENEEKAHPGQILITPDGMFSEGSPSERLVPIEIAERIAIARRVVADRCLYGVDINPMAVEMAKLSMWLITVDASRPFTFLDHAFKRGDSLLGITSLEQLENFSLRPGGGKQQGFATLHLRRLIDEVIKKREMLEAMPSDTPDQIAAKVALYTESEEAATKLGAAADVLMATELKGLKGSAYDADREASADNMLAYWAKGPSELQTYAQESLKGRRCLHWAIAFPEVMDRGGFDGIIGNPPFLGGLKLETAFGSEWRNYVVTHIARGARGVRGTADLCSYFLLRASTLICANGVVGLITTNSIAEGDTRVVGLDQLLAKKMQIFRATASQKWPGTANLEIAILHLHHGAWSGHRTLNGTPVARIGASLRDEILQTELPHQLRSCAGKGAIGATILGKGFILDIKEAKDLLTSNPANSDVLFPLLIGDDINSRPDTSPSRWVINFKNWTLDHANDYPDCLEILRTRVKPERDKLIGKTPEGTRRGRNWWLYAQDANKLFRALAPLKRTLVKSIVSKHHIVAMVPTGFVPSHVVIVFPFDDWSSFAILQSVIHEQWAAAYSSRLETRLRYTPGTCLETFVFPSAKISDSSIGERYHQLRADIALNRNEGMTAIHNRLHDLTEDSSDIGELRNLQVAMDQAVAAAYGWSDLDLGHGFHETKQGIRFTISEDARREVLERLLVLNHQRYAEEEAVAALRHPATPAERGRKKKDATGQTALDF